jgi:hypothetical protein
MLKVFENRVMGEKVIGGCRKLHDEELHNL